MGPTGKFLEPQGEFTETKFEEAYAEQAKGLTEGKADFLLD
jgi:5-methyltetrahydrofolate--homocysteine methyltransferase